MGSGRETGDRRLLHDQTYLIVGKCLLEGVAGSLQVVNSQGMLLDAPFLIGAVDYQLPARGLAGG